MRQAGSLIVLWALTGASCTVGPDYVRPEITTPDEWHQKMTAGLEQGDTTLQTWWTVLDDPLLSELVQEAQGSNRDLQGAYFRILEARAIRGIAIGDRYPQVGVEAEVGRTKASESQTGVTDAQSVYAVGVGASWELDLFGRVRRSVEAATAEYQASLEDYRDLLVTLLADVALNYIDARTFQERLRYARANIVAQTESLSLTRDRFEAGLTSALDVAQAESNLASSASEIPRLEGSLEAALNRLAVLAGQAPGAMHARFEAEAPIPLPADEVAVGLPAELLRQRPDVRRAERRLAAQTARIGIATADLYPRFSLSGVFGSNAADLEDFAKGNSKTWSIGLPVSWAIFSGGRIQSQIRAEEARTDQAFKAYQQSVLRAIEDVETSLAIYTQERLRKVQLELAADATERAVELVRTQYLSGLTNFQNVLDTQRSLFRLQDQLAESEGLQVQNLVVLYKALGGGWDTTAPDIKAPPGLAGEDSYSLPAESPGR